MEAPHLMVLFWIWEDFGYGKILDMGRFWIWEDLDMG